MPCRASLVRYSTQTKSSHDETSRLSFLRSSVMHQRLRKGVSLLAASALSLLPLSSALADNGNGPNGNPGRVTAVAAANPKTVGVPAPNILSPELIETIVAQGSFKLENP